MRGRSISIGILSMLATASLGQAEWLVMRDGTRIETEGGWKIEGRLVVFHASRGGLASVRSSRVDLEASRRPAIAIELPETSRVPVRSAPEPVLVLTNADVPAARSESVELPAAASLQERASASRAGSRLAVDSWAEIERPETRGVEIVGSVRNHGPRTEQIQSIAVSLRDESGRRREAVALPGETRLEPGEKTEFRVEFFQVGQDRGRPHFRLESTRHTVSYKKRREKSQ